MGPAAPWFILGVMLFSYAVRAVYIESCAMFTRGGMYRVVKEAMGGTLAKLSVSALIFDYVLTGPISGVSAGQYIVGLVAQTSTYFGHPWTPSAETVNSWAAGIAVLVTVYFWWRNTRGLHEPDLVGPAAAAALAPRASARPFEKKPTAGAASIDENGDGYSREIRVGELQPEPAA